MGREGVGVKMRRTQATSDSPGWPGGVKSYFPGCISFPWSSLVVRHIHQHFGSRNRSSGSTAPARGRRQRIQPTLPGRESATQHDTLSHHQLSPGRLTPLPGEGRFPETPRGWGGEGREQAQFPDAGAELALMYPKENQRKEEEGVGKGREDRRSNRRKGEVKARQTGNPEDIPEAGLCHGSRCAFSHIQGLVSPRPKSQSIEAASPSYISTLIHVTFVSIRI